MSQIPWLQASGTITTTTTNSCIGFCSQPVQAKCHARFRMEWVSFAHSLTLSLPCCTSLDHSLCLCLSACVTRILHLIWGLIVSTHSANCTHTLSVEFDICPTNTPLFNGRDTQTQHHIEVSELIAPQVSECVCTTTTTSSCSNNEPDRDRHSTRSTVPNVHSVSVVCQWLYVICHSSSLHLCNMPLKLSISRTSSTGSNGIVRLSLELLSILFKFHFLVSFTDLRDTVFFYRLCICNWIYAN